MNFQSGFKNIAAAEQKQYAISKKQHFTNHITHVLQLKSSILSCRRSRKIA